MSSEITIAIITSVASLLVAVVSLVNSMVSTRQSAHSARMIESLRFELADKKSTQTLRDEYLTRSLESLDILIRAIQRMKDVVQLVLSAKGSSFDSESAIDIVSQAREHVFASFEEQLPNLEEGEAKGAHRAKNQALTIELSLRECLKGTSFVSELSSDQKQALSALRNDLTEAQNLLRDSKATTLMNRMQSYG